MALRIVFAGTPNSRFELRAAAEHGEVVAVYTHPIAPRARPSADAVAGELEAIKRMPVHQPKLPGRSHAEQLAGLHDLMIVVAYGLIPPSCCRPAPRAERHASRCRAGAARRDPARDEAGYRQRVCLIRWKGLDTGRCCFGLSRRSIRTTVAELP